MRVRTGFISGPVGDPLPRRIAGNPDDAGGADGRAYRHRSKLEALFGPGIWQELSRRVAIVTAIVRCEPRLRGASEGTPAPPARPAGHGVR